MVQVIFMSLDLMALGQVSHLKKYFYFCISGLKEIEFLWHTYRIIFAAYKYLTLWIIQQMLKWIESNKWSCNTIRGFKRDVYTVGLCM